MLMPYASANSPCIGGTIAPPKIAITKSEEPCAVASPRFCMDKVKMVGNIMELNKPTATKHHKANWAGKNKPKSKQSPAILAKIDNVLLGKLSPK